MRNTLAHMRNNPRMKMRYSLSVLALTCALIVPASAACNRVTTQQRSDITDDTGKIGGCVLGALLGIDPGSTPATDATVVVAKCAGATLVNVLAIASTLIDAYTKPSSAIGVSVAVAPPSSAVLPSLALVVADARRRLGE